MRYIIPVLVSLFLTVIPSGETATLYGGISNDVGRIGVEYCAGNHQITKVLPGSPAEKAGVAKDDKVLAVNDDKHFPHDFGWGEPGSQIKLTLQRKKVVLSLSIVRQANW